MPMAALVLKGAEAELEEVLCNAGVLVEYEEATEVDVLLEAAELACEVVEEEEELDFDIDVLDGVEEVDEVVELFEDAGLEARLLLVLEPSLDPIQNSADTNPPSSCPS